MSSQLLIRSELSVPGGNPGMAEKALVSGVDAFFIDLEDSVAPDRKVLVRDETVRMLAALDWGSRERVVRINAIDTPWCLRDVVDLVGLEAGPIDRLVVPKVKSAGDVAFLNRLIRQAGWEVGRDATHVTLEVQIEDSHGLANLDAILRESHRVAAVTFGQGDFAAATGMPAREIGVADEWDDAVPGDRWMFPRQQIVFAASRAGVPALNGPYAAFADHDGFRAYCRMSRALGFVGIWCIHPDQIPIANDVFSPTQDDVAHAETVMAALEAGWGSGVGALALDQVMADEATVRMARSTLTLSERIRGQQKTGTH